MPDRVYVVTLKKKRAPFNAGHGFGTLERIEWYSRLCEGTRLLLWYPWAFSFDIAGNSSAVNDCPRSDSAIDCRIPPRRSSEHPCLTTSRLAILGQNVR